MEGIFLCVSHNFKCILTSWQTYHALSYAPIELKATCTNVLSMLGSLHLLAESVEDDGLQPGDEEIVVPLEHECHALLSEVGELTAKVRLYPESVDSFTAIQEKLFGYMGRVDSFLEVLRE